MVLLLSLFVGFSRLSSAEFSLASGLRPDDRLSILEVLGLGSSMKNLSTLSPLGTESGLEVAIAFEFIDTSSINQLITDENSQNTLYYPKIIIGKGIYDRLDLFFQFIPYTATFGISEFGSLVRMNLYQSTARPFYVTGLLHANSTNFNNQLVSRNLGADLMLGYGRPQLSFFTTVGWAGAFGKFVGGVNGITDTGAPVNEEVKAIHTALGLNSKFRDIHMTFSLDYYVEPVYTAKLSLIF